VRTNGWVVGVLDLLKAPSGDTCPKPTSLVTNQGPSESGPADGATQL